MSVPLTLEFLHELVATIRPACDRAAGPGGYVAVAIADVDRFRAALLEHGALWGDRQLALVEAILEEERRTASGIAGLWLVKQDVWAIAFTGVHASRVERSLVRYADRIIDRIRTSTEVTMTVTSGTVHHGPDRVIHSLIEAFRVLQHPAARVGGRRVPFSETHPWRFEAGSREPQLWRLIQLGDHAGIMDLIRARLAADGDLNADMLQAWAAVEIAAVGGEPASGPHDGRVPFVPETERIGAIAWLFERELARQAIELSLRRYELREVGSRPSELLIASVVRYIRANFADDLSLGSLAKTFDVSPFYLSHLFRRDLGCTYLEHLRSVRVEAAQGLLANSEDPIARVAERAGFQSLKTFRNVFRRTVGESPTGYRRRVRGTAVPVRVGSRTVPPAAAPRDRSELRVPAGR
jgi:AraC-like DNA-binding protein